MTISSFSENQLEQISRVLAGAYTHSELTTLLHAGNIPENGGEPKWQRALSALSAKQIADRCGNNVAAFIQRAMDPVRFSGNGTHSLRFGEVLMRCLPSAACRSVKTASFAKSLRLVP